MFYSLFQRAFITVGNKKPDSILTKTVGRKEVGFLKKYNDATSRKSYKPDENVISAFQALLKKTDVAFFIPDKFRVYFDFIEDKNLKRLPDKNWEFLSAEARNFNAVPINLTSPFIEETKRLLESDQYIYWRDDTHWNGNGMKLSSKILSDLVLENNLECLNKNKTIVK